MTSKHKKVSEKENVVFQNAFELQLLIDFINEGYFTLASQIQAETNSRQTRDNEKVISDV